MNNEKQKIIPQLRFPEFIDTGDWDETTLEQVADYENGKAHEKEISETGKYKVVNSKFISTDGEVVKYTNSANLKANIGDILMVLSDIPNGRAIAKCFYVDEEDTFTVNQRICKITPIDIDNKFLFYIQNRNKYFLAFDDGVKQTNLRKDTVLSFPFLKPKNPKEQQKVAKCLSSLDEVITAETEKLDLLQDHKKGLLQQLFPIEGETQPKFRFPEFEKDGDWVEKELEEVCNIHNNRRKPISSSKREKGDYPYYGASGIIDYVKNYIFNERLLLIGEDGAKWGAYEKTAFIVEGKYWVNNHAHVLEPTLIDDKLLENFLVKMDIHPFITGAAPPKLTLNNLKKIPVPVPPSKEEQKKIANCFSSADDLIEVQKIKIKTLKKHKKGLMQQLFPNVNSVSI